MADVTTPGFQKLSIMYLPDVGLGGAYQLRFVRRPSDGAVTEDRTFNIPSVVQGFLGAPLVAGVDYAPEREPNRCVCGTHVLDACLDACTLLAAFVGGCARC